MSESAPGGSSGESKEPVVRRKDPAGRAKAGKDGAKVEKAVAGQQRGRAIQASRDAFTRVYGNGGRGGPNNNKQQQQKTNNNNKKSEGNEQGVQGAAGRSSSSTDQGSFDKGPNELELRMRMEIRGGAESRGLGGGGGRGNRDREKTVTKEDNNIRTGGRKRLGLGAGDGETIVQQEREGHEKSGTVRGSQVKTQECRGSCTVFDVDDYLMLLKLLKINLPRGVLNSDVVRRATNADVIQDAEATVEELERFQLQFRGIPRLSCREVKHALSLKKQENILQITHMIFFEKVENRKKRKEKILEEWQKNKSNTGHGFVMRSRYKTTPISTPAMYDTVQTRSWTLPRPPEEVNATITPGSQVKLQHLETMEFSFKEPQSSPQKFGMFFQNPADEMECLKFFHEELQKTSLEGKKVNYTKGNSVEFGFLKGCLDFLAEIRPIKGTVNTTNSRLSHTQEITEKIIIECKGTTGDMVGKVFTKPAKGCCQAKFIKNHEYYYQTQAYRYLMSTASRRQTHIRAVMVVRHYHDSTSDFYWNYLEEDHVEEIDALRLYCQEQALPRYLAILSLIFEKECRPGAGGLDPSGKHSQET